jgi:glutamyl endopeptidase
MKTPESSPSLPAETVTRIAAAEPEARLNAGVLSYPTPETVCGHDDREKITDTTASPYYWVCQLSIEFDDGTYVGSGWLCSTASAKYDVVATAGHCVYSTSSRKFAKSIDVIPGRNGTSAPYGRYTVGTGGLRASEQWKQGGANKSDYDYGVILIPKTNKLGACGMWIASSSELENRTIMNAGYPGDKEPYGYDWEDTGPIQTVTTHKLHYMNDTAGGQSGSPVYALDKGNDWSNYKDVYSVGIHGYGGCPNKAVRITEAVYNDIIAWSRS